MEPSGLQSFLPLGCAVDTEHYHLVWIKDSDNVYNVIYSDGVDHGLAMRHAEVLIANDIEIAMMWLVKSPEGFDCPLKGRPERRREADAKLVGITLATAYWEQWKPNRIDEQV